MRTYRIILSKLGLAPDKQPSPPVGDNPDDVQKIVDAVLGVVGHLEHALYRVEEGTTRRAPVSAEYIGQLRAQLAQQTLALAVRLADGHRHRGARGVGHLATPGAEGG